MPSSRKRSLLTAENSAFLCQEISPSVLAIQIHLAQMEHVVVQMVSVDTVLPSVGQAAQVIAMQRLSVDNMELPANKTVL